MTDADATAATALKDGPLSGLRVLDLTRVLAGPSATQVLGDLGADVLKIERPLGGDDTRGWGPPFVQDAQGRDTPESAYFLCANRNKRSVAVDLASPGGAEVIRRLAARADIVVENYKLGDLDRRGLGWAALSSRNPRLIFCSITGFGQDGPHAARPGYDFMIQAMGGVMSVTGEADGAPMKVGVGITDVMTGMYAVVAILAAVRAREITGRGQRIDLALFDTQLSWLINHGLSYLTDGATPHRQGNAHPNIVPYEAFPTADGWFVLAVGNDRQFAAFCAVAGRPDWAQDPDFATNRARVVNRARLTPLIHALTPERPTADWLAALEGAGVPCGPVNTIPQAFADPQAVHRGARVRQPHPTAATGAVETIANPIRLSDTPVSYRRAPPTLGQHTAEALREAGFADAEIDALAASGAIGA